MVMEVSVIGQPARLKEGDRVVFSKDGKEGVIEYISDHSNVITRYIIRDDNGKVHDVDEESIYTEGSFRITLAKAYAMKDLRKMRVGAGTGVRS